MALNAEPVDLAATLPFREAYRREMHCQIVHDSIHARAGWSREFLLRAIPGSVRGAFANEVPVVTQRLGHR